MSLSVQSLSGSVISRIRMPIVKQEYVLGYKGLVKTTQKYIPQLRSMQEVLIENTNPDTGDTFTLEREYSAHKSWMIPVRSKIVHKNGDVTVSPYVYNPRFGNTEQREATTHHTNRDITAWRLAYVAEVSQAMPFASTTQHADGKITSRSLKFYMPAADPITGFRGGYIPSMTDSKVLHSRTVLKTPFDEKFIQEVRYEYNENGNLLGETEHDEAGKVLHTITYHRNEQGELNAQTNETPEGDKTVITYAYIDELERREVVKISYWLIGKKPRDDSWAFDSKEGFMKMVNDKTV